MCLVSAYFGVIRDHDVSHLTEWIPLSAPGEMEEATIATQRKLLIESETVKSKSCARNGIST
jgi:hypothetical protein